MAVLGAGATHRTPERNSPFLGGVPLVYAPLETISVTTGNTPVTLTAAQLLIGVLPVNCANNGVLKLPTAAALNAGIPGVEVGTGLHVWIVNPGAATCTLAINTGITNKSIDSDIAVLAMTTHTAGHYYLVCTGVANPSDPSTSDTWDLYGFGVTTATS
jgi:hypothetical protein